MLTMHDGRVFSFILYPEHINKDTFNDILGEKFNTAISPLHQPDDEVIKEHYHVILMFGGKKKWVDVNQYCREKYNCPQIESVVDTRKMMRYLIHMDNEEKEQFDHDYRYVTANFDIRQYYDDKVLIQDIIRIIDHKKLKSFKELIEEVKDDFNKLEKVSKSAYFFKTYLEDKK